MCNRVKARALALDIARRLKAIRSDLRLDIPAMAEYVGVTRNRYYNWEHADNLPSELAMIRLCDNTRVTMDYIYRGVADDIPNALASRLSLWEFGEDPDLVGASSSKRTAVQVERRATQKV